jgi:hypothetical protein
MGNTQENILGGTMSPDEPPREEMIAATDELFKEEVIPPPPSRSDGNQVEESTTPRRDKVERPPSPIRDYVRELQQEYEEQEEEGKL